MPIDMTRPVMTRAKFDAHGKSGPKIYMYKDEPGVYYDAHGKEVPAVVAKAAGYNIDVMEKTKTLNMERARLIQRYNDMLAPPPAKIVEIVRPKGHKLVKIGDDLYHIEDIDGNLITSAALSRHYATVWLDDIDPGDGKEEKEALPFETLPGDEVSIFAKEFDLPPPSRDSAAEPEGGDPKDANAQA